ncbi:hypothetical protein BN938_0482 [Mucinivorans hirudinis]|uniref:Uncharacterized protein n=1 Tax=Mucinivorans hirudinis TaxID=1433126 RepID=A0A060R6I9_9BACT|nr:hypothetical protein BN938_0482 [Mucinivorans hirudinis]
MMMYSILGETYRLKEMFRDVYDIEDSEQAKYNTPQNSDRKLSQKVYYFYT